MKVAFCDVILTLNAAKRKDPRLHLHGLGWNTFFMYDCVVCHRANHSFRSSTHTMHEGSYFTYIMASRSHTLYIGVTSACTSVYSSTNGKSMTASQPVYNCDRLVWFEAHDEVTKAIAREKTLKGWKRDRKIALIESMNPVWSDLSRKWYDYEPADYRRALDRMNS